MRAVNPVYVLRNHMAEIAIRRAQSGDYAEVRRLERLLRHPLSSNRAPGPMLVFRPIGRKAIECLVHHERLPRQKTDAEWRAQLDPLDYKVTRQATTEHPFSGRYGTTLKTAATAACVAALTCSSQIPSSTRAVGGPASGSRLTLTAWSVCATPPTA